MRLTCMEELRWPHATPRPSDASSSADWSQPGGPRPGMAWLYMSGFVRIRLWPSSSMTIRGCMLSLNRSAAAADDQLPRCARGG
jgi:hypothetical protein